MPYAPDACPRSERPEARLHTRCRRVSVALTAGILIGVSLSGCQGGSDTATGKSPGASTAPEPCTDCLLTDDQNFQYAASLSIDVLPGSTDIPLVVDWSALTQDIHGHTVGDDFLVEEVLLLAFPDYTPEEVTTGLERNTLAQQDISLGSSCIPTGTACALSEFEVRGRDIDLEQFYLGGYGTWLALLRSDFESSPHTMVFLPPQDGGAEHIPITDDSTTLDMTVDLTAGETMVVASSGDISFDWSALTTDGLGNALDIQTIDTAMLGRFDLPIEELEARIFDLERLAAERFVASVSGSASVRLDALEGPRTLDQLSSDGTWLLALYCSSCTGPAPKHIVQLQPQARR